MDQEAKKLRSTRTNQEKGDEKEDIEPPQEPENIKKTFYALLQTLKNWNQKAILTRQDAFQ